MEYASLSRRFAAATIDGAVLCLVIFPFWSPSESSCGVIGYGSSSRVTAAGLGVLCLYFSLMESSRWQATLGKRLLGIRVARVDQAPLSLSDALGRTIAKILLCWSIFYFFFQSSTTAVDLHGENRLLHDQVMGTVVVRIEE